MKIIVKIYNIIHGFVLLRSTDRQKICYSIIPNVAYHYIKKKLTGKKSIFKYRSK